MELNETKTIESTHLLPNYLGIAFWMTFFSGTTVVVVELRKNGLVKMKELFIIVSSRVQAEARPTEI